MQIPPAECWDLHLYGGPTGHSTSLVGPRDGPADVRVTRHIPHFRGFGRHALEPVRPSDPLSIQWTAAGTGDAVWDNPTSGQRVLTAWEKAMERLKSYHCFLPCFSEKGQHIQT